MFQIVRDWYNTRSDGWFPSQMFRLIRLKKENILTTMKLPTSVSTLPTQWYFLPLELKFEKNCHWTTLLSISELGSKCHKFLLRHSKYNKRHFEIKITCGRFTYGNLWQRTQINSIYFVLHPRPGQTIVKLIICNALSYQTFEADVFLLAV